MNDIMNVKRTLDRKAREFDANKEMCAERIMEGFKTARERLERAEKELLKKLDIYFDSNMFSEQLAELNARSTDDDDAATTLEEAAAVASLPVPADFGPDEGAFGRLYKEISRLADKTSLQPITPPPAPKDLAAQGLGKNGFYDGVSLSWAAVTPPAGRCVDWVRYKVEMTGEHGGGRVYDSAGPSCAFQKLKAGVMYAFRVLCVWDGAAGPWSDAVEFTTSPVPAAKGLKCSEAKECSARIVWDPAPVGVTWEAEVRKDDACGVFRKGYEGEAPSCTLESLECGVGYAVRVRARLRSTGACGEWSGELRFRTKKWDCAWKACPASVGNDKKYALGCKDGRPNVVAIRMDFKSKACSIVLGNNPIPVGTTVSWRVHMERDYVKDLCPGEAYIGVAPIDMDQNMWKAYGEAIYVNRSFGACSSKGERRFFSDYSILDLNYVEVIVDIQKRLVSFADHGAIYATVPQIPLDKPLVPFVLLGELWNTAELIITE